MSKTFALGYKAGQVDLWCEFGKIKAGRQHFDVINGAWTGSLNKARNEAYVHYTGHYVQCVVVWEGVVPEEFTKDYNVAMDWIARQL